MKPSWPQAKVFVAVARAQAKAGDLPAAVKTFVSAKAAMKANTDRFPWLRGVGIATAQFEAGDAAGARQTVNEITDANESAATFVTLAGIAAQKSDKALARELLDLARKAIADNKTPNVGTLPSLARALAHAAGPTADLAWIAELGTPEEKGLAYAAAAAGLVEAAEAK